MASRRDELSAHTFARKRTLAAFLQPESGISDEGAPRPVRAVVPGAVMSIVLVAGFIAWGAIAPSAPPGWDTPGEHIIVDKDSTTRYVVLKDKQLHPVLNYASAKLVLNQGKGKVVEVSGKDIDESGKPHGATIGIPYAPDRLPDAKDAGAPKEWAVCEKPGTQSGGEPQQGVFVLGGKQRQSLHGKNRLGEGQALYVEDSKTGVQYLVDGRGTRFKLESHGDPARRKVLVTSILRNMGEPQKVSTEWLESLREGEALDFPNLRAASGSPSQVSGLPEGANRVGRVLRTAGTNSDYYLVLKDRVQKVTPLMAKIAMGGQGIDEPDEITTLDIERVLQNLPGAAAQPEAGHLWPKNVLTQVNTKSEAIGGKSRTTSCSIFTGKVNGKGQAYRAAWAGPAFPQHLVDDSAGAYVTSGSGLLFQETGGAKSGGGTQYLLTDSGLRYALRGGGQTTGGQADASKAARARLDYQKTKVAQVPARWAAFLPKGPALDTKDASQEQGM